VNGFEAGLLAGALAGALLAETIAVVRVARRRWRAQCTGWDASSQAAVDAYQDDAGVDMVAMADPEVRRWVVMGSPAEVLDHNPAVQEASRIVEAHLLETVPADDPLWERWKGIPGQRGPRAGQ
jgi:hypothetical protein